MTVEQVDLSTVDCTVLGKLMTAESMLHVFTSEPRLAEFCESVLGEVPGLASCRFCFTGLLGEQEGKAEPHPEAGQETLTIELATEASRFGQVEVVIDHPEDFRAYHPFVRNFLNTVAITIENRRQQEALVQANQELSRQRQHLEQQVLRQTEELRHSRERLALAVEASKEGLWDWNRETGTVFYSSSYNAILGLREEEVYAEETYWFDRIHPGDKDTALETIRECIDGSVEDFTAEFRMRRADQSWCWVLAKGKAVARDDQGQATRVTGVHRDITRQKELESSLARYTRTLEESEKKYRLLAENTSDIIWLRDLNLKPTYISPAVERVRGYTVEEAMQQSLEEALAPGSVETARKLYLQFKHKLDSGEVPPSEWSVDLEHRCRDGSTRWLETKMFLLRDQNGKPSGFMGVGRDVTERRQVEQSLREAEEKFRLTFFTSPDAISITRLDDGVYVEVNQGFQEMFGYRRGDVIGKSSFELDIWGDPHARQRLVDGLQRNGSYQNLEASFRRRDGSLLTGLMSARVISIGGEPHIISITRDITRMRQAEQQESQLKEQLQQAQKMDALGTLAGGVAHDFNNILASIMGYSELACEELPEDHPARGDLEEITKASERAKKIIRQILTFSRKSETELQPLSLNDAVRDAGSMLQQTIPKTIELHFDLEEPVPTVLADSQKIAQVVMNLVTNSCHAIDGSGRITVATSSVEVERRTCTICGQPFEGPYLVLSVIDNGTGMPEEVQAKIFEPFYTTKDIGQGTGLGLSTTLGIVALHGGHINFESVEGKGTRFDVYLPFAAGDAQESQRPADREKQPPATGSGRILVVDDEAAIRRLVTSMLGSRGYDVVTAASGEAALELFSRQPEQYDGVILDLGMPGIGGKECLTKLRQIRPDIKVIIASGYIQYELTDELSQLGARMMITKPYRLADLLNRVATMVQSP